MSCKFILVNLLQVPSDLVPREARDLFEWRGNIFTIYLGHVSEYVCSFLMAAKFLFYFLLKCQVVVFPIYQYTGICCTCYNSSYFI